METASARNRFLMENDKAEDLYLRHAYPSYYSSPSGVEQQPLDDPHRLRVRNWTGHSRRAYLCSRTSG